MSAFQVATEWLPLWRRRQQSGRYRAHDTTTPSGKAMFGMLGVFAEFERSMIRERVNSGLARAKAKGFGWIGGR